jgi:hypothetical protein
MSWLSQGIESIESWVSHLEGANPALAAQGQAAQTAAKAAAAPMEQFAVAVVDTGVNAVLGLIPGGAALDVVADAFIDEVIGQLFAKKSKPAPVVPLRAPVPGPGPFIPPAA